MLGPCPSVPLAFLRWPVTSYFRGYQKPLGARSITPAAIAASSSTDAFANNIPTLSSIRLALVFPGSSYISHQSTRAARAFSSRDFARLLLRFGPLVKSARRSMRSLRLRLQYVLRFLGEFVALPWNGVYRARLHGFALTLRQPLAFWSGVTLSTSLIDRTNAPSCSANARACTRSPCT